MAKAKPTAPHTLEPVFTAIGKDIGAISRNINVTNDLLQQILAKVGNEGGSTTPALAPAPQPQSQTPPTPTEQEKSPAEKWLETVLNSQKMLQTYRCRTDDCYEPSDLSTSQSISVPTHLIGKSVLVRYLSRPTDDETYIPDIKVIEQLGTTLEINAAVRNGEYFSLEFIVAEEVAEDTVKQYPQLETEWR